MIDLHPRFSVEQLRQLKGDLRLLDAQIAALQDRALPMCAAILAAPEATHTEVKAALKALHKALERAHRELALLGSANQNLPARFEAWQRVQLALFNDEYDAAFVSELVGGLARGSTATSIAIAAIPAKPRQHHAADPYPIAVIARELLNGFLAHYKSPLPPYEIKISTSPNGRFRRIVDICYQALGRDESPERAVKTYVRGRRLSDRARLQSIGSDMDSASSENTRRRPTTRRSQEKK